MREWSALASIYPVFQYRFLLHNSFETLLNIIAINIQTIALFSKIMALGSKRMNGIGGCSRVWMWTGSRVQCLTTLAGLVHPLVPGLYPFHQAFTHPNPLRWPFFYPISNKQHSPQLVLCSKLQAVPHSSPATTPLSVSTPPYRQNGGGGDTSRPPLSPQQVGMCAMECISNDWIEVAYAFPSP